MNCCLGMVLLEKHFCHDSVTQSHFLYHILWIFLGTGTLLWTLHADNISTLYSYLLYDSKMCKFATTYVLRAKKFPNFLVPLLSKEYLHLLCNSYNYPILIILNCKFSQCVNLATPACVGWQRTNRLIDHTEAHPLMNQSYWWDDYFSFVTKSTSLS